MDWLVLKFGGTSVSTKERWATIADIVSKRLSEGRVLLVCSALSGVSNALEQLADDALSNQHEASIAKIVDRHESMANDLGIENAADLLGEHFNELTRLAAGISLVGEASPRVRARILAQGELMSTKLGVAFLTRQNLSVGWADARQLLTSQRDDRESLERHFLSAVCQHEPDPTMRAQLESQPQRAILTQGFIARDDEGETVLLGRGGSDTSAAYFAARLAARRCEIWTDVPGMYTANPREIPAARLLKLLGYDEAQEIATTGAKVLHPRCIPPCRAHGIPIQIRYTDDPELPGTTIARVTGSSRAQVKAISAKMGVTLVSMDTIGMWQQVGFLADIFGCFKDLGLSVDLVSTSEMNVTVSLDPSANALEADVLARLERRLSTFCRVAIIQSCAAVSLVGRQIRAILHKLGPALTIFEEHRIHLVSQAASDLNFTVVVDESQAARLVRELHQQLLGSASDSELFGPTWQETFDTDRTARRKSGTHRGWWWQRRSELLELARQGTPRYVYDESTLRQRASSVIAMSAFDRVFYAMKANSHAGVLRVLDDLGFGFECVSPNELAVVRDLFGDAASVLYTPNFAPRTEYEAALADGALVTLDNVQPLRSWPEVFSGAELIARLDPGRGQGHHDYVKTAGAQSKFGISPDELDELVELAELCGAKIVGLHAHSGSGIKATHSWRDVALFLIAAAKSLTDVRFIDVGGGLGVPDEPGGQRLDLSQVNEAMAEVKAAHPEYELWFEPGRYITAECGVLLTTVTQTKRKGDVHYIGVDTGMNSLIRPALYGAWHPIANLTRLAEPQTTEANVVGPICETGDTLGYKRPMPDTREGDVVVVGTAGAYGYVMSSRYNLRDPAPEYLLESP